MEKRAKRQTWLVGIISFVGYFIGTTAYILLGKENGMHKFLFGVLFAGIMAGVFVMYQGIKYPGLRDKQQQLSEDERNIYINGRSALTTIKIVLACLAVLFLIAAVMQNTSLSYLSAGFYLLIVLIMGVSRACWSRCV